MYAYYFKNSRHIKEYKEESNKSFPNPGNKM